MSGRKKNWPVNAPARAGNRKSTERAVDMISDESVAKNFSYRWLDAIDYFPQVKPLLESGRWYLTPEGRFARTEQSFTDPATPWVKVRRCPHRQCDRHFKVLFSLFGMIPEFCFECYKVVVRPRTVVELFKLLETFRRFPDQLACKCGIELRDYVPAHYGGYVYALGADEGRECLRFVEDEVARTISPELPVTLKRGCTEFGREFGDPSAWEYRPGWRLFEKWVDEHFIFPPPTVQQPSFLQRNTMRKWLHYAQSVDDTTYKLFTGGETLMGVSVECGEKGEND